MRRNFIAIGIAVMLLCIPLVAYLSSRGSADGKDGQVRRCTEVLHEIWLESLSDEQYVAAEEWPQECRGLTEQQYMAAAIAAMR